MTESPRSSAGGDPPKPPPKGGGSAAVIPLYYDFLVWLGPKVSQYPKVHRFTLGDRVMVVALDVLERLIAAQYDRQARRHELNRANLVLEQLRYLIRLSKDLRCLNLKEYEFAARSLVEVGKQVGGWLRFSGGRPSRGASAG
jgi:hypothetical protein